jgi:Cu+-exporting ATPase
MGCGQSGEQQEQATESMETMGSAVEDTMAAMTMVDPVCGMEVAADSEWTAEYEGVTYYFCSEQCRDEFMQEPTKYLEAMGEESSPM